MSIITSTRNTPFSWEAIQASKPWLALTPQQQIWCLRWLTNGHDYIDAVRWAYPLAKEKSRVPMSHEVRQHKNVLRFFEFYKVLTTGAPSREEQIADVLADIWEVPDYQKVPARRLLAQLTGVALPHNKRKPIEPESESDQETPTDRIPDGAVALRDHEGIVRGYKTASGEYVQLPTLEATT